MDRIFNELGEICRKARDKNEASRTLLDAVGDMLREDDWKFDMVPEHNLISTVVRTKVTSLPVLIRTYGPGNSLAIHVMCPTKVPLEKKALALEFINACNYGLMTGNFEMDMDDGEVRFRTSLRNGQEPITRELMKFHLLLAIRMMDDAYPALMGTVFGGLTPAEGAKQFREC